MLLKSACEQLTLVLLVGHLMLSLGRSLDVIPYIGRSLDVIPW